MSIQINTEKEDKAAPVNPAQKDEYSTEAAKQDPVIAEIIDIIAESRRAQQP